MYCFGKSTFSAIKKEFMNRLGIKSFSKTAGITTAGITLVAVFTGGLMPDKVNALEETFFGFVTDGNNYTILNVPESLETSARSIDGTNIVGWYKDNQGNARGFLYDGVTWNYIDVPNSTFTHAYGIDGNNIVGWYGDTSNKRRGYLYNGVTWNTLDFPGAEATAAYGVQGGNIVGAYREGGTDHGYLYNGTTWTNLDFPGSTLTYAFGISNNNIVGLYLDANGVENGFLYDGTTWNTLNFPGAKGTGVVGIDGNNLVGYYRKSPNGLAHGFLYDGTTWKALDDAPGATDTVPTDISGNYIVGFASVKSPEPSSLLSLLALGTLGAASTLKRKLKPSKSTEKETTKVG